METTRTSLKNLLGLFNICSGGQILLITIPLKLNSSNPWKHKMNKSRLFCFSVSLLGTSVICLSSYFYCSKATPALVHGKLHWHSVSCLSAGKDMPSGRVGLLEEQKWVEYPLPNRKSFHFIYRKSSYGKLMQGTECFQRNFYSS